MTCHHHHHHGRHHHHCHRHHHHHLDHDHVRCGKRVRWVADNDSTGQSHCWPTRVATPSLIRRSKQNCWVDWKSRIPLHKAGKWENGIRIHCPSKWESGNPSPHSKWESKPQIKEFALWLDWLSFILTFDAIEFLVDIENKIQSNWCLSVKLDAFDVALRPFFQLSCRLPIKLWICFVWDKSTYFHFHHTFLTCFKILKAINEN